ncbi:MAG TPA: low-specificity L-threonine aldolase [Candidatus Bathyarchaeota archaeon]|nr:low-specificity L-threonine aldolase [Candidatus Bathyarchaeota archaeon]
MRVVDLRSDTVTLPTEEMLEAIRRARLGDDVYGEDPTVNELQELAASRMGKDAALLVTSGTQGNLVSLMSHARRGEEVILEAECHIYYYEVGGISALAGLIPRPIRGHLGVLDPRDVEAAIRPKDIHQPRTSLVCMENTHNRAGGTVWTPEQMRAVYEVAKEHGLSVHLDGARIFNAAVYLGVDVKQFTKYTDSVMFCLSKGLSAPIGSLVVGDEDFIERARRVRKMLGGGMRQAGIIAAAGIIALEKMVDRLKEDHENAQILAKALAKLDGIRITHPVQTNIIIFDVSDLNTTAERFIASLAERGVKASQFGRTLVRMVTHRGIEREDIEYAISVVEEVVSKLRSA